jgi:hypothetical protein
LYVAELEFSLITVLGPTKDTYVGTGTYFYINIFGKKWPRPLRTWATPMLLSREALRRRYGIPFPSFLAAIILWQGEAKLIIS